MYTTRLLEIVDQLTPAQRREVEDFAQFLLEKRQTKGSEHHTLRQDWAGALKEHREGYTSLELQQKSLEWRGD